ncbi:MAG TPA: hypothetical protein VKG86_11950, partial [Terracidiphilus sp.]|nr:hypothetical protein [Terracidiphilus sp.]
YVWVVGHKRHHLEPCRWVQSGHTVAYVPIHPYDVKGQPPINRKDRVFAVNNRSGLLVEPVKFETGRPILWLQSPPKEFRNAYLAPLSRADEPHMEAHQLKDAFSTAKGTVAEAPGIQLSFDRKSESFMMHEHVMQGNKNMVVMAPITNRGGNLQNRGGSFGGGHVGFSGGGGGGGSRGGSFGGGGGSRSGGGSSGSSSGGSHSGGSSGSGGGGSHGGGGGGSTASSSSAGSSSVGSSGASSPASGGSSAGGSSHH